MRYLYSFLLWAFFIGSPIVLFGQLGLSEGASKPYQIFSAKTTEKMSLDGLLDEAAWAAAQSVGDFWMAFPRDGEQVDSALQTEVKILFDDNMVYIGAKCYTPHEVIIPTLKRDSRDFWQGDVFAVVIDPYKKATNGFFFATNPAGVQTESLISGRTGTRNSNSSGINSAWDNKWFVETSRGPGYWIAEMAIPFKSLRFDPNKPTWGINFSRGEPHTNAWHAWAPVPVQFRTVDLGYTGEIVWPESLRKSKSNISVIPYVLGGYSQDFEEGTEAEFNARVGADAKVAITPTLNLDITVNPDFSQVDVDEQVTNLNTFNIRFPERRLFFLENSDLFSDFGIPPIRPFFSRRIGLDEDRNTIPILYGARLSGNLNKDLRIGLMNLQTRETDEFEAQNYTSLAVHQRVMERSVVKAYAHNRQAVVNGNLDEDEFNRIGGIEFDYFSLDAKWRGFVGVGLSQSDGFEGDNYLYKIGGGYDGRNWSFYTNLSGIGNNYYADMGFIPFADHYDAERDTTIHVGYQHLYTTTTYSIYPEPQKKVNAHRFSLTQVNDVDGQLNFLQGRYIAGYTANLANTGELSVEFQHTDRELLFPFEFTDGPALPAQRYNFSFARASYATDRRKALFANMGLQYGGFFNGTRLESSISLRYRVQPWGNFTISTVYNRLTFPEPFADGNLFLIGPKFEINFSRSVFWTTFLQYNTQADNFNINSRLQWRFQPMSDLFIVYSDNYAVEMWGPKNRALVVKLNYWLNI